VVGNSLGGYIVLLLAARGRASRAVLFAPAGGWAPGDDSWVTVINPFFRAMLAQVRAAAPHAAELLATDEGRRLATAQTTVRYEHIPAELLVHQLLGTAGCEGAEQLMDRGASDGWELDAAEIGCPLRIVWGTADRVLPWPGSAARYRAELPNADWVILDDVGHLPQLDVPVETAQLILDFTG